jgi:hypothetical protein
VDQGITGGGLETETRLFVVLELLYLVLLECWMLSWLELEYCELIDAVRLVSEEKALRTDGE